MLQPNDKVSDEAWDKFKQTIHQILVESLSATVDKRDRASIVLNAKRQIDAAVEMAERSNAGDKAVS